jgi:hypothetical protein
MNEKRNVNPFRRLENTHTCSVGRSAACTALIPSTHTLTRAPQMPKCFPTTVTTVPPSDGQFSKSTPLAATRHPPLSVASMRSMMGRCDV